jgi:hypothetical protein
MKKSLLTVLFVMIAASWCLAQTDSLPASAPELCQPGACAVPCQMPVCAEPFVPKWAVGMKASTLTNFPGNIIVEKMFGSNNSLRITVNGDYEKSEYYYIYKKWWASAGLEFSHGCNIGGIKFLKPFFGIGTVYRRDKNESQYSSSSSKINHITENIRFFIPFKLLHNFKACSNNFAVGIEADILNLELGYYDDKEINPFTGYVYNTRRVNKVGSYLFSSPNLVIKYFF